MTITTIDHPPVSLTASERLLRTGAFLLVIVVSYLAMIAAVPDDALLRDQASGSSYMIQGVRIAAHGLAAYVPDNSAYGYPLFLAACIKLGSLTGLDALQLLMLVQFVLHTLAAWLALAMLKKLTPHTTFPVQLTAFILIQANPVLLGLTRFAMTDGIAVFVVTLLFWSIVCQPRGKYWLAGLAVGTAIIMRPFHLVWIVVWLSGIILVAYLRGRRMRRPLWRNLRQSLLANRRKLLLHTAYVLLPVIALLAPQILLVYQSEGRIALTGGEANSWMGRHIVLGLFVYKYEPYIGDGVNTPGIEYTSRERMLDMDNNLKKDPPDLRAVVLNDLPAILLPMPFVKLAGIFQNYEWTVLRHSVDNQVNLVVVWGGVMFFGFVYLLQSFLVPLPKTLAYSAPFMTVPLMLFLALSSYIFLYVFLTLPEGRYAMPTYPALVALAMHRILNESSRKRLLLSAVTACILYVATFIIFAFNHSVVLRV